MKNKLLSTFIIGVMLLALCSIALATPGHSIKSVTITSPAASGTIGIVSTPTLSWTGNHTSGAWNNITLYNDTTRTSVICTVTAIQTKDSSATCTATASSFPTDCTGHTIIAVYQNRTHNTQIAKTKSINSTVRNDTNLLVKFDKTNPTISVFEVDREVIPIYTMLPYKVTATDDCDSSLTYNVNLYSPTGNTVNKTSATSEFNNGDINEVGSYRIRATVTDNGDNKGSDTTQELSVKGSDDNEQVVVTQNSLVPSLSGSNTLPYIVIFVAAIIVILLVAGYLIFFR